MIVVLDCETTGLDPLADAVVEVAGAELREGLNGGRRVYRAGRTAQSLVSPGRRVPPSASAVHHLRDEDLTGAPRLREALLERVLVELGAAVASSRHPLVEARGPDALVFAAHNAEFDRGFLGAVVAQSLPAARWLCTWRCALHLWPNAPSHSNQVLRYWLPGADAEVRALVGRPPRIATRAADLRGDDTAPRSGPVTYVHAGGDRVRLAPALPGLGPHRALYDALTTAVVLSRLLALRPLDELLVLQHRPVLLRTVGFGKHRGVAWAEVDRSYLRWVAAASDPPFGPDVVHTARHYLGEATR